MKLKHLIYSLLFVFTLSIVTSCRHETCPTYATSQPTKRKKKRKKKNAPWHKSKNMKKGKKTSGTAPE